MEKENADNVYLSKEAYTGNALSKVNLVLSFSKTRQSTALYLTLSLNMDFTFKIAV